MLMYEVSRLKSPLWRLKSSFSISPSTVPHIHSPIHHGTDPGGLLPSSLSRSISPSPLCVTHSSSPSRASPHSLSPSRLSACSSPLDKKVDFHSSSFVHLFATKALPPLEEDTEFDEENRSNLLIILTFVPVSHSFFLQRLPTDKISSCPRPSSRLSNKKK